MEEANITYYLYTRTLNGTEFDRNNLTSIHLDLTLETVFVIHGWTVTYQDEMPQTVKDSYLTKGDYNVILVDWSNIAGKNYVSAKHYVPDVGRLIGGFILLMVQRVGLIIEKVGLVGHSLGAHVSGVAGRILNGSANHLIGKFDEATYIILDTANR